MNITTYGIGDILIRKYDTHNKKSFHLLEVMGLLTDTCSAGTQVFYLCRPLVCVKRYTDYKEKQFDWEVGHGISEDDKFTGYRRYREDELLHCSKELYLIVTGVTKSGTEETK